MTNTSYKYQTKGFTLGLASFLHLSSKLSLSAEAGAMNYQISSDNPDHIDETSLAPYLGINIGYSITENIKIITQYYRYEKICDSFQMESDYLGLGFSYQFKNKNKNKNLIEAEHVQMSAGVDNDGVADKLDICSTTSPAHMADGHGCVRYVEQLEHQNLGSIKFAVSSSVVTSNSYNQIEKLANYMNRYPKSTVLISGHASKTGREEYNIDLSIARADAVAAILTTHYNINRARIMIKGFGSSQPIVNGMSSSANIENRRVELQVTRPTKKILPR
ncbi:OmpA family protein [Vibrio campbellii]|uniref:OmpA family protein n=1 Tax=Vibrio campbellii TaxID=680 RepID=UPI00210D129E|nr:OmpA family protein [Vibrio campbellii]UTZ38652.1 OmpA family protein [Vibrio campbellii]